MTAVILVIIAAGAAYYLFFFNQSPPQQMIEVPDKIRAIESIEGNIVTPETVMQNEMFSLLRQYVGSIVLTPIVPRNNPFLPSR